MYCINLESEDPFFNLAVEEFLLKQNTEDYLILGINSPSVIIGKHQVANKEVNTKFISENDIPVIRRISGGGTVFHDNGNINFAFIRQSESGKQVDFRKYTKPVIDFLSTLGVEAKFEGKSDLRVGGFKISGNAEHVHRNRVLHHGTLLFNTSMDQLGNSIRKDKSCYISRGVESNPASVINLQQILNNFQDIYEFRSFMMNYMLNNLPDMIPYQLSQSESEQAELIASSKYKTWKWNWAYGPDYQFNKQFEIDGKPLLCYMTVRDGIIVECKIEGSVEMSSISEKLKGCRHMANDLMKILKGEIISVSALDVYNFF